MSPWTRYCSNLSRRFYWYKVAPLLWSLKPNKPLHWAWWVIVVFVHVIWQIELWSSCHSSWSNANEDGVIFAPSRFQDLDLYEIWTEATLILTSNYTEHTAADAPPKFIKLPVLWAPCWCSLSSGTAAVIWYNALSFQEIIPRETEKLNLALFGFAASLNSCG
jgi:hypothetical protein